MIVDYDYFTDNFCRVESRLRRTIGQYARQNRWIYIGLTQQKPRRRFSGHQYLWAEGHKWDKMIVLYRTNSYNQMVNAEIKLIEYAYKYHQSKLLNTETTGKRPIVSDNANGYWVYILVQRR